MRAARFAISADIDLEKSDIGIITAFFPIFLWRYTNVFLTVILAPVEQAEAAKYVKSTTQSYEIIKNGSQWIPIEMKKGAEVPFTFTSDKSNPNDMYLKPIIMDKDNTVLYMGEKGLYGKKTSMGKECSKVTIKCKLPAGKNHLGFFGAGKVTVRFSCKKANMNVGKIFSSNQ